jgi:predicted N-acetyltransferase YhbS
VTFVAVENGSFRIRRFEPADVPAAAALSAAAFGIDVSTPDGRERWEQRLAYPAQTDPEGAFVAERDGQVIGVAEAVVRERLWCLSMLAVRADGQGAGAGRALIRHALAYGADSDAGLIMSSNDPRALRLYGLAGFALLPTFHAEGEVRHDRLPRADPAVRAAEPADLEDLGPISRELRGAAHTAEIHYALGRGARVLRLEDRGFVVVQPGQNVWLLAARDDAAASTLLAAGLAAVGPTKRPVRWLTGEQQWAIELLLRAGLRLSAYGALAVRGNPGPLRPFIPTGSFS